MTPWSLRNWLARSCMTLAGPTAPRSRWPAQSPPTRLQHEATGPTREATSLPSREGDAVCIKVRARLRRGRELVPGRLPSTTRSSMLEAARAFEAAADAPELPCSRSGRSWPKPSGATGRLDEAAGRLAGYEARARQIGRISAMVGACRVRGLLEADRHDAGAAQRAFDEAAPLAERLSQPLEAARLAAAHGAVLARLGRRTAALGQVAQARHILKQIGALPYLQRADREFERLGHGSGHRSRTGKLTASESVVAGLVASGLSNKQTAERLIVSVKAVEFHLANIYAKLGVSSRSQLAARHDLTGASGPAPTRKP